MNYSWIITSGDKEKRKVIKAVGSINGVESIALDDGKLTVTRVVNPETVVACLGKLVATEIIVFTFSTIFWNVHIVIDDKSYIILLFSTPLLLKCTHSYII